MKKNKRKERPMESVADWHQTSRLQSEVVNELRAENARLKLEVDRLNRMVDLLLPRTQTVSYCHSTSANPKIIRDSI